jgi:hypothetical protein
VRLANENAVIAERTCFPSFLILLEGTYLSICGAVFSDAVCIDRLTTVIPLEKAAYDTATLDYTVRTLRALVRCVKDLELHYKDITELVDIPKTITNGAQPHSLSVGTELELRYHKRLMKGKRLWIAYMKTESEDEERKVVVKFVRQYSIKMHRACANAGIAPALLFDQEAGYGWKMIVMEYLDGYRLLFDLRNDRLDILKSRYQTLIQSALDTFHGLDFVHDGMRSPDIFLGPDDKTVKFIGFNRADKAGEA